MPLAADYEIKKLIFDLDHDRSSVFAAVVSKIYLLQVFRIADLEILLDLLFSSIEEEKSDLIWRFQQVLTGISFENKREKIIHRV